MDVSQLKQAVCEAIDASRVQIVDIGESIMDDPELRFKEFNTSNRVKDEFQSLGLAPDQGMAITGFKATLKGGKPGPTIALMGELDALQVPGHPRANSETGAAHACGHNAQIAGVLGAAMGLSQRGIAKELARNIVFYAVPAEEYVEINYRIGLVKQGATSFLTGKQELVKLGEFDPIDSAMMIHSTSPMYPKGAWD